MIVGGGGVPATNFTRHEVQRPRPPHVAVMSMPPSWAARRIVVPGVTTSSRRREGSFGSGRTVSAAATRSNCIACLPALAAAGILARMAPPTLETLRHCARVAGFAWSDEELETIRPALERALAMLQDLETLGLSDVEPATQYRIL